jgi:hypothetical protein
LQERPEHLSQAPLKGRLLALLEKHPRVERSARDKLFSPFSRGISDKVKLLTDSKSFITFAPEQCDRRGGGWRTTAGHWSEAGEADTRWLQQIINTDFQKLNYDHQAISK